MTDLLAQVARTPRRDVPPLLPGVRAGRYEIIRAIGRGGFGTVYEAHDTALNRLVALKVQHRQEAADPAAAREGEIAARLAHPNIAAVHDAGLLEGGSPYLVYELLHGETLESRLARGPIPSAEAVAIVAQVARALVHAHAHGVVHRDLKPANVFLTAEGDVKVLDFGVALLFGKPAPAGGTPAYMAPEQRRGGAEDARTDLYALGMLLREMLSDERAGATAPRSDRVPPSLRRVLTALLAEDPAARPRSARAALSDLDAAVRTLAPRRARRLRFALAFVAALGLALTLGAQGFVRGRLQPRAPDIENAVPSIAVLPFADMSAGKDQEYFSDGIAEEILNALVHVEGLRVVGRTSSFSFKGKNEDVRVIGQKLGVRTVLEGTVRTAGERLRVSANLVDVSSGYQLWAAVYDRDAKDVFVVQEEIAAAVVRALEVKLLPPQAPTARERRPSNLEAYRHFLIGQQLFYRGTDDSARLGAQAFERAIAADPAYAPAHAGLAMTLVDLEQLSRGAVERAEIRGRAFAAAERALALAPELAEAHSARGLLRSYWGWDWAGARRDLERAVRLSPRSAQAHRRLAIFLAGQGEIERAITSAQEAADLDPLAGVNWRWLAIFHAANGRTDRARAAVLRALELLPESEYAHHELAGYAILDGRPAEALSHLRYLGKNHGLQVVALAEHELGRPANARRALGELISRVAKVDAQSIAAVYAWWGDIDRAFDWLERAVRERQVMAFLKSDPFLRSLRGDPRWDALLREVGLPAEDATP